MSKQRFFVLTDISDEEPDDKQSLVRLLLYSCDIDLEGLVATTSQWKAYHKSPIHPEYIEEIIDAYGKVFQNLRKHRRDYPTPEFLHSLVRSGNDNDMRSVGDDKESTGSELLAQRIVAEDPRPLWVGIWGGATTLAQALWSLRARMPADELDRYLSRLWVFEIQGQDDAGAWIASTFPSVHFLRCQFAWRGMSYHIKHEWFETKGDFEEYVSPEWARANLQEDHGALGEAYPTARYIHEGDSPSILHLVPNGLNDPFQLDQGGWGGRYGLERKPNVWSGGCPVTDESRFGEFQMYSDAVDRCSWEFWDNRPTCNAYNTMIRWRRAYQNDFAARMDWCVKGPAEANHAPNPVVNGDATLDALEIQAQPGETLTLDASASSDPNGSLLRFHWWIYEDPGTYEGLVALDNPERSILKFELPKDAAGSTIHLILNLENQGDPPLTTYRRIIISCMGKS